MDTRPIPRSSRLAGIITAAELAAGGAAPAQIRQLVRRGALLRLSRGVYAPTAQAAAVAGDIRGQNALRVAACLATAGPGSVASHGSAAIIHGLDLLERDGHPAAAAPSVTRPPGGDGSRSGRSGVCVHAAALPPSHVTVAGCVAVTSVARTVVDVSRVSSFRAGVVVADSALRRRLTSKPEIQAVITECARWPGIGTARQVLAFSDPRSESALESLSRVVFHELGLPAPDLQVWVGSAAAMIGRSDFLWREHRTIAEADGALKYADPSRARAQLKRDTLLREAGFEVVHFTWEEIFNSPAEVVARIWAAFRRAAILRGRANG
jgi:hypothetical protein